MSERIFPYKTIRGDLRLDVREVTIDEEAPSPEPIDRDGRIVSLFDQERSGWRTVQMKLELVGPAEELRKLPDGEGLTANAVFHSDDTHERRAIPLKRAASDAARWTAVVDLHRADYRGAVRLDAVVAGRAGGLSHRFLGSAEPWILHFDEPAIPKRGGSIKVRWVDFKSENAPPFLGDYVNEPFYADLTDEVPVVYLNKSRDFERLPVVLDDRRRRGSDLALHNAERIGIARSVWMAMLNAAIAGIREAEDSADPDWPEADWQRRVLRILLPQVYRDHADAEALRSAFQAWDTREGAGLLESRGQAEINRRIGAAKLLRRTLNLMSSASSTTEAENE